MRASLLAVIALCTLGIASAAEQYESFDDPVLQARYQKLTNEVRCLTCLNRSIAESTTPLAADLRREIRELLANGASDAEVVDFLTARYGDFVMYRPPFRPGTWVLWGGPAAFLLVGALIFARVVRSRMKQPIEEDDDA